MTVRRSQIRRPNGSRELPVRSMRIENSVWESAKRRADLEGLTMSNVAAQLIEGYALGWIDTPDRRPRWQKPRPTTSPLESPNEVAG